MDTSSEHQSPPPAGVSARLRRSTHACQRCRRRKQKCDLRYPKCSACEAAHAACLTYDAEKQAEIPRGYISRLENDVRDLRQQVETLKKSQSPRDRHEVQDVSSSTTSATAAASADMLTAPGSAAANPDPQDMVKSMGLVLLESSYQPRFMGTSSGVTFAKMVLAAIKEDSPPVASGHAAHGQSKQRAAASTPAPPVAHITPSFPPRQAAERIVEVYFAYRTPHVPVLERSRVREALDHVYQARDMPHNALPIVPKLDLFIANIVFAVGLHGMTIHRRGRPPQSEDCFQAALGCVESLLACSPSNLETLTVVLLLAQYISLNPSLGNLWQLTGMALRFAIDLGLHWETGQVASVPPAVLNRRRRLYWAAYRLDRFLCITLGRPFGIAELSMNPRFPDPAVSEGQAREEVDETVRAVDAQNQLCANHVVALYQLESEIKQVLYHQLQGSSLAYPRPDYAPWYQDLQTRLRAWKEAIPAVDHDQESIYASRSWWEAHHCTALLLLHRPNPRVPVPTAESLQVCFDVALRSIRAIKALQREGRISVAWVWVHHLFLSGLTMMYCIRESPDVRRATSIMDIMTASQDCASTLTALVERFSEAGGCRDVFERLSSATLAWLLERTRDGNTPSDTHPSAAQASGTDATMEMETFAMAGWGANANLSGLFLDDTGEFAQFLSMAAQWEDNSTSGGLSKLFWLT